MLEFRYHLQAGHVLEDCDQYLVVDIVTHYYELPAVANSNDRRH